MAIKLYTENFPDKIVDKLKILQLINDKDEILAIYVNTFLSNIRDTNILTKEKLIHWVAKRNTGEKKVFNFKKIKDISYTEKGLYGTVSYQLSLKKTFDLKLNRKDGELFFNLSLEAWKNCQSKPRNGY